MKTSIDVDASYEKMRQVLILVVDLDAGKNTQSIDELVEWSRREKNQRRLCDLRTQVPKEWRDYSSQTGKCKGDSSFEFFDWKSQICVHYKLWLPQQSSYEASLFLGARAKDWFIYEPFRCLRAVIGISESWSSEKNKQVLETYAESYGAADLSRVVTKVFSSNHVSARDIIDTILVESIQAIHAEARPLALYFLAINNDSNLHLVPDMHSPLDALASKRSSKQQERRSSSSSFSTLEKRFKVIEDASTVLSSTISKSTKEKSRRRLFMASLALLIGSLKDALFFARQAYTELDAKDYFWRALSLAVWTAAAVDHNFLLPRHNQNFFVLQTFPLTSPPEKKYDTTIQTAAEKCILLYKKIKNASAGAFIIENYLRLARHRVTVSLYIMDTTTTTTTCFDKVAMVLSFALDAVDEYKLGALFFARLALMSGLICYQAGAYRKAAVFAATGAQATAELRNFNASCLAWQLCFFFLAGGSSTTTLKNNNNCNKSKSNSLNTHNNHLTAKIHTVTPSGHHIRLPILSRTALSQKKSWESVRVKALQEFIISAGYAAALSEYAKALHLFFTVNTTFYDATFLSRWLQAAIDHSVYSAFELKVPCIHRLDIISNQYYPPDKSIWVIGERGEVKLELRNPLSIPLYIFAARLYIPDKNKAICHNAFLKLKEPFGLVLDSSDSRSIRLSLECTPLDTFTEVIGIELQIHSSQKCTHDEKLSWLCFYLETPKKVTVLKPQPRLFADYALYNQAPGCRHKLSRTGESIRILFWIESKAQIIPNDIALICRLKHTKQILFDSNTTHTQKKNSISYFNELEPHLHDNILNDLLNSIHFIKGYTRLEFEIELSRKYAGKSLYLSFELLFASHASDKIKRCIALPLTLTASPGLRLVSSEISAPGRFLIDNKTFAQTLNTTELCSILLVLANDAKIPIHTYIANTFYLIPASIPALAFFSSLENKKNNQNKNENALTQIAWSIEHTQQEKSHGILMIPQNTNQSQLDALRLDLSQPHNNVVLASIANTSHSQDLQFINVLSYLLADTPSFLDDDDDNNNNNNNSNNHLNSSCQLTSIPILTAGSRFDIPILLSPTKREKSHLTFDLLFSFHESLDNSSNHIDSPSFSAEYNASNKNQHRTILACSPEPLTVSFSSSSSSSSPLE